MKIKVFRTAAIVALLFAFTGCVSLWPQKGSGFLVDYSSLEPDPKREGVLYFRNPEKTPERIAEKYPAITIDPIVVYFDSDVVGRAVDPSELIALTERLRQDLVAALAGKHDVSETPGPNVARIRIALTGIIPSSYRLSPHPSLTALDLENASLEAEMIDSITAERVSALLDSRKRNGVIKLDQATIQKHAQEIIRDWVTLAAGWLDALYGLPKPASEPPKGDEEPVSVPG